MRRSSPMLVSAAALTVALSACTSGGGGSPTTSAPSSAPTTGTATTATSTTTPGGATGTSTGTTKAPDPAASAAASSAAIAGIPAAAKAHTPAGAEAFTRYFFDVVNKAWTTPTVGAIAALSEPTCKSCSELEATAVALHGMTAHAREAPVIVQSASAGSRDGSGRQTVILLATQVPNAVIDSSGKQSDVTERSSIRREITLTETPSSGWRVALIKGL
ncbi:DUF6318 family protein [Arsenicicoccus piscis]|nr:DUF6318 family protein [Arsenicicoccus piscis]MCH8627185.1 DUF6318 family protein [Arsenicicoccus piscis]